jgi:hypothetical protein
VETEAAVASNGTLILDERTKTCTDNYMELRGKKETESITHE